MDCYLLQADFLSHFLYFASLSMFPEYKMQVITSEICVKIRTKHKYILFLQDKITTISCKQLSFTLSTRAGVPKLGYMYPQGTFRLLKRYIIM